MKEVRFFVNGLAAPGGSKRGFAIKKGGVYTGRVAIVDTGGERTRNWRQDVAAAAMQAMKLADLAPFTGPIQLELLFRMPRPKSHFKHGHPFLRKGAPQFHTTRPDAGKLARSTQDALKHIVWRDDSQIVDEHHTKAYSGECGCWIIVKEIELET